MKTLVTGGSGFLGSHVADALSDVWHEVSIFDVRPSPYLREGQNMIVGNLLNRDMIYTAVKGMDVLYHFAGIAPSSPSCRMPPGCTSRSNSQCM
jgi:UDP-glucose 4-epimerase